MNSMTPEEARTLLAAAPESWKERNEQEQVAC